MFDILYIFDAPVDGLSEHGVIQCAVRGLDETGSFPGWGLELFECVTEHFCLNRYAKV